MGSYTWNPRPGLAWNALKSLRPIRGGWVNRIGLRNPGLAAAFNSISNEAVMSLAGIEDGDWERMVEFLWCLLGDDKDRIVEINLGCPNVHEYGIDPDTLARYARHFTVIAKLPPTDAAYELAAMCSQSGVRILHLSNTIPTSRGGESGRRLKALNLPIVESMKSRYPETTIVAGGGIYSGRDIVDYEKAGATHFSLSTIWFNPLRARRLLATQT